MLTEIDMTWIMGVLGAGAGQSEWGFRAASASWLLPPALVVVVGYAIWLYRRTTLSRRWAWALLVVRSAVLVTVVVMMFQPVLVVEAASQVRQHVLVLMDGSSSMALQDQRQRERDRAEASLASGRQANALAAVQRDLGRGLRQLHQTVNALERSQLTSLVEAHAGWQAVLVDLEPRLATAASTTATNALRPQVERWAAQAGPYQEQIEQAVRQGTLDDTQRQELIEVHRDLVAAVDETIVEIGQAALQMGTASSEADGMPSRHQLARGLLREHEDSVFDALDQHHQVRYFTFGDALHPLGEDADAPREPLLTSAPEQESTQLGTAMDEVVARHAGQPIAGVVVLSDGGSNRGLDPVTVARRLGDRGIPVYTIGLGLPDPPDVLVTQVVAPPLAFVRDRVPVRAEISSLGFAQRDVTVTAELDGVPVAEKTLTLDDDRQWVELPFSPDHTVEAGELVVRVSELAGEVSHANNRSGQNFRVIDERIRVLYVEGIPRWEFRYLRQVLLRDHRLHVHLLMTEGDRELAEISAEHLGSLPSEPERLFEYDLVILGDVLARYFSTRQLELLRDLVRERGGALAMIAGPDHAPASYVGTPLEDVLPVRLGTRRAVAVEASARWRITDAGRRSAMTRLAGDDERNAQVWHLVRPMLRLPDLEGLKPAATALAELEHSHLGREGEPYPLLAWHRYGSGRSLFLASDQLWRLRYQRGDEHHARFWGQTIQFLTLARVMGEAKRVQIVTDAERYRAGQRVQVTAHVLGEGYEPLAVDSYDVVLDRHEPEGESRTLRLEAVPGTPGVFETRFTAEAGSYQVHDPVQPEQATTAAFRVEQVPLEMIEPAMQEHVLRQIAERSGGRYFTVSELPALPGLMDAVPRPVTIRHERELWNQWWLLALLVALLGGEWFVRRRYQQL